MMKVVGGRWCSYGNLGIAQLPSFIEGRSDYRSGELEAIGDS